MSVDELLKAVDSLNESDLNNLVGRALSVRASRQVSVLTVDETALFLKINAGIPEVLHREYLDLLGQRDRGTIDELGYERMLELGDRIDELAAQRAGALAELAKIRRVPLMQLMDDLGIYAAGVR